MPKGVKTTQSPIQRRIREICEVLLYVPAPPLVALVEEKLVNQISEDMVKKAHNELMDSRKSNKTPPTSSAPNPTKKPSPLSDSSSESQE